MKCISSQRKKVKKVVIEAKLKTCDDLYNKLGTRGENDTFKLAKLRKKKSKDLEHVKCIKSDNQKVSMKDNDIK